MNIYFSGQILNEAEKMKISERLREKIYDVVEQVEKKDIGISFSGGIDSSLLAKVCKDLGKDVKLLTVGFPERPEMEISKDVANGLDLPILQDRLTLEDLEKDLQKVIEIIEFERIARLGTCLAFYYVFRLASEHGIKVVLSANGADELFCGYTRYKEIFGDKAATIKYMEKVVHTAKDDKLETDKLARFFDVEYICPFLSEDFIKMAIKIPIKHKIKSEDDETRKHILREVALEIGVPQSAAMRPKKAFQYSSGVMKSIRKLAKNNGFKRIDGYIENLRSV